MNAQRSTRRTYLLRLLTVIVMPGLLLLAAEAALRLFHYGHPMAFTVQARILGEKKVLSNPYFTWKFFTPGMARECEHFALSAEKRPEIYRVFLVGGSAAQGDPEPAYGMARMLELMLADRYPALKFEVVNAAITAVNSHAVRLITTDCMRHEPDLLVVYMGNNEVIGPYGIADKFGASLLCTRMAIAARSSRIGQLLYHATETFGPDRGTPAQWRGMETFTNSIVHASAPGMARIYRQFDANLHDICGAAEDSGVPVLLSTVGVNVKDSPPFASLHRSEFPASTRKEWNVVYEQGCLLEKQTNLSEAVGCYLLAEAISADYADLHFRLARCQWLLGYYAKARARYFKALNMDALRFRADTRINAIIRQVADAKRKNGVHLVDAAKILEDNSPHNTPGTELFYEHVHLNFHGTYLVASALAAAAGTVIPAKPAGSTIMSEQECARHLAFTGWDRHEIATRQLSRMESPPYTGQLYHNERVAALKHTIAKLDDYTRPPQFQHVLSEYRSAMHTTDPHPQLSERYVRVLLHAGGNLTEVEKHSRILAQRHPQSADTHFTLGDVLACMKRFAEAEACYGQALIYRPLDASALTNLGAALHMQGKIPEAITVLERAIDLDPRCQDAHYNLATVLLMKGMNNVQTRQRALTHFRLAYEIDPDHGPARTNLASLLYVEAMPYAQRAEYKQAKELLLQVVEVNPDMADAHYNLAVTLLRLNDPQSAKDHLTHVLRLNPSHPQATALLSDLVGLRPNVQ